MGMRGIGFVCVYISPFPSYHRLGVYYYNLRLDNITDNKKFWKTMKPLFGDKGGTKQRIVLVEGDRIINEDAELAQTFNNFFDNVCVALWAIIVPMQLVNGKRNLSALTVQSIIRFVTGPLKTLHGGIIATILVSTVNEITGNENAKYFIIYLSTSIRIGNLCAGKGFHEIHKTEICLL